MAHQTETSRMRMSTQRHSTRPIANIPSHNQEKREREKRVNGHVPPRENAHETTRRKHLHKDAPKAHRDQPAVVGSDQPRSPGDKSKSEPLKLQTVEFDKVRQLPGIGEGDEVRPHVLQLRHLVKAPLVPSSPDALQTNTALQVWSRRGT